MSAPARTKAATGWRSVCPLDRLQPGRGAAALLGGEGGRAGSQIALFRLPDDSVFALDNYDPCGGAPVLSRGIIGDRGGEPVVASPLYKQAFSLVSGECLDEPGRSVRVYPVRVVDGWVHIGPPS